ncbi:hypothetical protein AB1N83_012170 [Pleurotus pulmonarius]
MIGPRVPAFWFPNLPTSSRPPSARSWWWSRNCAGRPVRPRFADLDGREAVEVACLRLVDASHLALIHVASYDGWGKHERFVEGAVHPAGLYTYLSFSPTLACRIGCGDPPPVVPPRLTCSGSSILLPPTTRTACYRPPRPYSMAVFDIPYYDLSGGFATRPGLVWH